MTKRMLIDAYHPEETRVVVLDGNRLEEFDVETQNKKPLKGNIYLAKVVRVEPSLQAAFVEYGGNRHGFLAFSEIHPDYYQIPVADRQRLLEMQAAEAEEDEEYEDEVTEAEADAMVAALEAIADADQAAGLTAQDVRDAAEEEEAATQGVAANPSAFTESKVEEGANPRDLPAGDLEAEHKPGRAQPMSMEGEARSATPDELMAIEAAAAEAPVPHEDVPAPEEEDETPPETLGGRGKDESDHEDVSRERRIPPRFMRHYKIQEVIRRRQIMLVQVVKEERGNKGAALTTYISLAGRFSVLMPNSPRGGGISRKITSAGDRKRLREAIQDVGLPKGMSLIVRTAGASRPKPEITRDCEYLLRLWDEIRSRTMESVAPALIYEEADLIKRSIRDTFNTGIEEIQVEGEDAYRQARDFMRMLMPQHERKIRLYRDQTISLFARSGVDQQLDAMMSPVVQLKSGGYIVINQTEALVSIDVNSGRATRDRHIEDTALRTNQEAAEEIARQLRLRDLAGLIVIDFIDMESNRNDAQVERRLKEALKNDRARIQVGRISHFGLLEMSRQRLRPSVTEHSFVTCEHCKGLGIVRSADSAALQVLRQIDEEGAKRKAAEIIVHLAPSLALHLLNRKRDRLTQIEQRHSMAVLFEPDEKLLSPAIRIERVRPQLIAEPISTPSVLRMDYAPEQLEAAEAEEAAPQAERIERAPEEARAESRGEARGAEARGAEEGEGSQDGDGKRRRRRRRRRGGRREDGAPVSAQDAAEETEAEGDEAEGEEAEASQAEATPEAAPRADRAPERAPREERGDDSRIRRRGRRGGNRFRRDIPIEDGRPREEHRPYVGPTPADPFAGGSLEDIFDAMAAAEEAEALRDVTPAERVAEAPVVQPEAAVPVAEVAAETAVPEAEAAPVEVAPVEAVAEETPAKPKRRATKKVEKAEKPAKAAKVEKPKKEKAEKPAKAPRTARGKKADAEVEASPEAPAAEAEAPAKPKRRTTKKAAVAEPVAEAAVAPVPEAAPVEAVVQEPVAAASAQPVLVEAGGDDTAPKKRGWWRR